MRYRKMFSAAPLIGPAKAAVRTFQVLVFALVFSACGDATGPSDNAAGTYNLVTVNGSSMPAVLFQNAGGRIEITSGSMVLRSDFSYTETLHMRAVFNAGGTETDTAIENGTYTRNGPSLHMTIPASAGKQAYSYQATIDGNTVSYTYEGVAMVFRK